MTDEHTIYISASLYEECEQQIDGTSFETVDEYARFILAEVLEADSSGVRTDSKYPETDEEQLEALGYLDR